MAKQSFQLAKHNSKFRRLWMFPRNVRRVEPWRVAQQLSFLLPFKGRAWDQASQNEFRKKLVSIGIVQDFGPYDPHSGGPRTLEAQLRYLGLIYKTLQGHIEFTLAGEDVSRSISPLAVLQHQLLHLQYPSPYGNGSNVKINPELRVKPLLFILNLLKRADIASLTVTEMVIPVVYGHNHACEDFCVEKILKLRSGSRLQDLIDSPAEDLYTPRTAACSVEARFKDVLDIANTCKNYLESCLLIIKNEQRSGASAFSFNPEYESVYSEALSAIDAYIPNPENEESFQRAFGVWNRSKDLRRLIETAGATDTKSMLIQACFYEYCGTRVLGKASGEVVEYIFNKMGVPRDEIVVTVEKLLPRSLEVFEAKYLELSVGGAPCATEFEKATNNLFNSGLGLEAQWIGSKRRSHAEKGAFTDILVHSPQRDRCGIVDAKAVSRYNLPSSDYAKMISNYLPNYQEIAGNGSELAFCTYVAGGFSESFSNEAKKVYLASNIPCSGLRAADLLKMSKEKQLPQKNWEIFRNNGLIRLG